QKLECPYRNISSFLSTLKEKLPSRRKQQQSRAWEDSSHSSVVSSAAERATLPKRKILPVTRSLPFPFLLPLQAATIGCPSLPTLRLARDTGHDEKT
ncbi:hypothetical protein PMAYCL1PPCAC_30403, partial [Pristionchus mayeri]